MRTPSRVHQGVTRASPETELGEAQDQDEDENGPGCRAGALRVCVAPRAKDDSHDGDNAKGKAENSLYFLFLFERSLAHFTQTRIVGAHL